MSGTDFDKQQLAEQLEELARKVYLALAERFRNDVEAHTLFNKLAAEEQQHGLRLKMLRSTRQRRQLGPRTDLALDLVRLAQVRDYTLGLLQRVSDAQTELSADQARQLSVHLEEAFADAHAHVVLSEGDEELRQFFLDLASQDRAHAALLQPRRPKGRPQG